LIFVLRPESHAGESCFSVVLSWLGVDDQG
jgi:hypothetical protein